MKKIPLLEKKTFGTLLGDSLEFIIQNILGYSKAFLIIVLPPLIVVATMLAFMYNSFINTVINMSETRHFDMTMLAPFWSLMSLMFVLFILILSVSVLQYTVLYRYMMLYETMDDPASITIAELWDGVKSSYGRMLASFFWLLAVILLFLLVLTAVFGTIMVLLHSVALNILVGLGCIIFYLYVAVAASMFLLVRMRERLGLMDALTRSFRLTSGHWWRTFGLFLLIGILSLVTQYILLSPLSSIVGASTFPYTMSHHYDLSAMRTPWFGIIQAVSVVISIYISVMTGFAVCINYYSLVSVTDAPPAESAPMVSNNDEVSN